MKLTSCAIVTVNALFCQYSLTVFVECDYHFLALFISIIFLSFLYCPHQPVPPPTCVMHCPILNCICRWSKARGIIDLYWCLNNRQTICVPIAFNNVFQCFISSWLLIRLSQLLPDYKFAHRFVFPLLSIVLYVSFYVNSYVRWYLITPTSHIHYLTSIYKSI